MKKFVGLILAGGKVHNSLFYIFGEIPTPLVPIYGKPIICYILEKFKTLGIEEVFVTVGFYADRVKRLLTALFGNTIKINFIDVDFHSKPGGVLIKALDKIAETFPVGTRVFVNLSDSLFMDTEEILPILDCEKNFLLVSDQYDFPEFWCFSCLDEDNKIMHFEDKPQAFPNCPNPSVLTGGYMLTLDELLTKILKHKNFIDREIDELEISDLLSAYISEGGLLYAKFVNSWIDVGHLNKYHQAKETLMPTREFNAMEVDNLRGVIVKRSENHRKLAQEYYWYTHLPIELQSLTPRVMKYRMGKIFSELEMEYYGYPSLMELWLYGSFDIRFWKNIIERLWRLHSLFLLYRIEPLHIESFKKIYCEKLLSRLERLYKQDELFRCLLEKEWIIINGKLCHGVSFWKEWVEANWKSFINEQFWGLLHGDLCFANLLYDTNTGLIKMIDPRGKWGENIICGDTKYDLAKLRHSIHGNYEFIIADLFLCDLNRKDFSINYKFPFVPQIREDLLVFFDTLLSEKLKIWEILCIEGLLFLSMIPLHKESIKRQLVMFAVALDTLEDALRLKG